MQSSFKQNFMDLLFNTHEFINIPFNPYTRNSGVQLCNRCWGPFSPGPSHSDLFSWGCRLWEQHLQGLSGRLRRVRQVSPVQNHTEHLRQGREEAEVWVNYKPDLDNLINYEYFSGLDICDRCKYCRNGKDECKRKCLLGKQEAVCQNCINSCPKN